MIFQCCEICQCNRVPWIVLCGWNPVQIPTDLKPCNQWFEEKQCNAIKTVSRCTAFWNNVHWHIFDKPNIILHFRWIRSGIQTGHSMYRSINSGASMWTCKHQCCSTIAWVILVQVAPRDWNRLDSCLFYHFGQFCLLGQVWKRFRNDVAYFSWLTM